MRFPVSIFVSAIFSSVNAILPRVTNNRYLAVPGDVGVYHTDAFEILGEKYASEKPESQSSLVKDISDILAGYCPLEDSDCVKNVYKASKKQFQLTSIEGVRGDIMYPDNFDADMRKSMDAMMSIVNLIGENNLDDVVLSLEDLQSEINDRRGVNEDHQFASLAALSVAIESTKLWHAVHHDNEHPLHDMIQYFSPENEERRLQGGNLLNVITSIPVSPEVILADVLSAFESGIIGAEETNLAGLLSTAVPAISASASAFFGGTFTIGGDDEYYYYYDDDGGKADDDYYTGGGGLFCLLLPFC